MFIIFLLGTVVRTDRVETVIILARRCCHNEPDVIFVVNLWEKSNVSMHVIKPKEHATITLAWNWGSRQAIGSPQGV